MIPIETKDLTESEKQMLWRAVNSYMRIIHEGKIIPPYGKLRFNKSMIFCHDEYKIEGKYRLVSSMYKIGCLNDDEFNEYVKNNPALLELHNKLLKKG